MSRFSLHDTQCRGERQPFVKEASLLSQLNIEVARHPA
jgi:hypothetical protein